MAHIHIIYVVQTCMHTVARPHTSTSCDSDMQKVSVLILSLQMYLPVQEPVKVL